MPIYEVVDPKTGRVVAEMDGPSPPSPETVRKVLASLGATPEAPPDVSNLPGPPLQPSFGDVAGSAIKALPGAVSEFQNAQLNDLARTAIATGDLIRRGAKPMLGLGSMVEERGLGPGPVAQAAMNELAPKTGPEKAGALASTLAQFALPAGAVTKATGVTSLLGRAGVEAATGGLVEALRGGTPEQAGTAAALGAAGPVVGRGLEAGGEALAPRIINSLIKPLTKEFRFGRNPGEAVVKEKIVARTKEGLLEAINRRRQELGEQIGAKLDAATSAPLIDLGPLTDPLREAAAKARRVGDDGLADRLLKFADSPLFTERQFVTPAEAHAVKRIVGESTRWTNEAYEQPVNAAKSAVYRAINEAIEQAVPGVKRTQDRYANLLGAEKSLEKTINTQERQSMMSLPTMGTAGLGMSVTGNPLGGLGAVLVKKLAETTGGRTMGAQALTVGSPLAAAIQRLLQAAGSGPPTASQ